MVCSEKDTSVGRLFELFIWYQIILFCDLQPAQSGNPALSIPPVDGVLRVAARGRTRVTVKSLIVCGYEGGHLFFTIVIKSCVDKTLLDAKK